MMAFFTKFGHHGVSTQFRNFASFMLIAKRFLASTGSTTAPPSADGAQSKDGSGKSKDLSQPSAAAASNKPTEQLGWFSRLLVRDIDTGHEQHSSRLADKDTVYEMQFHSVKPECMDQYMKDFQVFINMIGEWKTGAQLAASWTVAVGDLDEAIHVWKFDDGYPGLDRHKAILRSNDDFIAYRRRRNVMLRSRRNQILLAFSFWPEVVPRAGPNIYELRSYMLRPGTMIEWGNCWAKGLKYRREHNEAVAGYFSHIGELYQAHHVWAFKSLQDRKEVREAAWSKPGWDECVVRTVPLIKQMTSRVLNPLPFSPLQ
jgi:hypothetical protein